jgi:hypothetical protein
MLPEDSTFRGATARTAFSKNVKPIESVGGGGRLFDDVHSFPTSRSLWDKSEEISEIGKSVMATSRAC